jgi:RsiW-degrading membrane proteinase PrsW (M82 family)
MFEFDQPHLKGGWRLLVAPTLFGVLWALSSPARELVAALTLVAAYFAVLDRVGLDSTPMHLDTPMWRYWLRRASYQFVGPVLVAVGLSYALWPDPLAKLNPVQRAGPLVQHGLAPRAAHEIRDFLNEQPEDLVAHRNFLWAHFSGPLRESKDHVRDDASVLSFYEKWPRAHPSCAQVAHLGKGIYWRSLGEPDKALAELMLYPEPAPDDVRYERAQTLLALGRHREAISLFSGLARRAKRWWRAEFMLAGTLEAEGRFDELGRVLAVIPEDQLPAFDVWRRQQLRLGKATAYLSAMGSLWLHKLSEVRAILGLVVFAFWFFAIRWWDRFEPEPLGVSFGAAATGALMSAVAVFLFDAVQALRGPFLSSTLSSGLLAAHLTQAAIQESLKLVPALLVGRFGKTIDEPVDWAIYGALGALGFAVWGGLFFTGTFDSDTAVNRLIFVVPFQVCLTGLVCLSVSHFRRRGGTVGMGLAMALPAAVLIHGAFLFLRDLSDRVDLVGLLAIVGAIGVLWSFRGAMGYSVARSPFRPRGDGESLHSAVKWFWRGFLALLIGTYVVACFEIGPSLAGAHILMNSVLNGLLITTFLLLGTLDVPNVSERDEQIY